MVTVGTKNVAHVTVLHLLREDFSLSLHWGQNGSQMAPSVDRV
jgi:hypothetical protein